MKTPVLSHSFQICIQQAGGKLFFSKIGRMRLDLLGYGQVYGKVPARSTACKMELKERLFNCISGPL